MRILRIRIQVRNTAAGSINSIEKFYIDGDPGPLPASSTLYPQYIPMHASDP
jgi:hypothetical protein